MRRGEHNVHVFEKHTQQEALSLMTKKDHADYYRTDNMGSLS